MNHFVTSGLLATDSSIPQRLADSETVHGRGDIPSRLTMSWYDDNLGDGPGSGGGVHGALTNTRDARAHGGEAVRCSALVGHHFIGCRKMVFHDVGSARRMSLK